MTALLASRSAAHFAVDLACGFVCLGVFVPGAASLEEAALGVFLYNLLAFATQPLLGAVCDRFPPAALGGPWLPDGGRWGRCWGASPWAGGRWSSAGWGNALFHPGGGRDALVSSSGTLWEGGVFVSTGALGGGPGHVLGRRLPPALDCGGPGGPAGFVRPVLLEDAPLPAREGSGRFPGLPPCPSGGWWGWLWGRWRSGPL